VKKEPIVQNLSEAKFRRYQWVDQGSSYLLAETLAALLVGQLEVFDDIQLARLKVWEGYRKSINVDDDSAGQMFHQLRGNPENVAHMFYLEISDSDARVNLMEYLRQRGISTTFHYQNLHESRQGMKYPSRSVNFAESIKFSRSILRLPLFYGLSEKDVSFISQMINDEREFNSK
jgi:dTDP-4-amino-4,6-dideoxygalactose transaminase